MALPIVGFTVRSHSPVAVVRVAFIVAVAPHAPVNTSTVHGRGQWLTSTKTARPEPEAPATYTPVVVLAAARVDVEPPSLHENAVGLLEYDVIAAPELQRTHEGER